MALADPQSITIGADTYPLPRTGSGVDNGVFTSEDGSVSLRISHSRGKRKRSVIRLQNELLVADALLPSTNVPVSASFQLVMDRPVQGYTNAELKDALTGLLTMLTASSGALITKLLGGES